MLQLFVAALVAAAPAPAPTRTTAGAKPAAVSPDTPIKLAAPQLSVLNMDARAGTFFNEHVAERLSAEGFRVTTAKEIEELVGLERRRQLVGCDENSACLSELANALGVDAIISGEIGKLGGKYQLLLKVNSALDGRQLSSYSARTSSEEGVLDEISRAAHIMAPEIARAFGRTLKPIVRERQATPRDYAWLPAVAGALAAGGGGFCMYQASVRYDQLTHPTAPMTIAQGDAIRTSGKTFQGVGLAGLGVGGAALIASGAMFFLGGGDGAPAAGASAAVLPEGGFAVGVTGVLPW
ncbi:MAG TPA: hypothetical protein VIG99_14570 [Myxococcaceae bacterium]|jgi:hypothetical protein